jgi:hypothetical protein
MPKMNPRQAAYERQMGPKKPMQSRATQKPSAPAKAKTKTSKPDNAHLRDMEKEARRVKKLWDPTARSGFQYGKGTM